MLGFAMDALQRYLVDIGPPGPDKGQGGKYLFLPPGYAGAVPDGYFVVRSPTYTVSFRCARLQGRRQDRSGRGVDEADQGLSARPGGQPAQDGIPQRLRQGHQHGPPDTIAFFEMLAQLVNEEPAEVFTPLERFHMQAIGIEKGKPFDPDAKVQDVALRRRAGRRRDGARQQLRVARSRHVLLQGPQMAVRRRRAVQLS